MLTGLIFKRFLLSKRAGSLIRSIAWLCIIGVGLGVFALVVVISVMNGFNKSLGNRLFAAEPHLVVYFEGDRREIEKNSKKWEQYRSQFLTDHPGAVTYKYEQQDVILRTVDGLFGGAEARGLEESALKAKLKAISANKKEGFQINYDELEFSPNEVILGADLARGLGIFEGDELIIVPPETLLLPPGEVPTYQKAIVRGELTTNTADIDAKALFYVSGSSLKRLNQSASIQKGVEIHLNDPSKMDAIKGKLVSEGFQVESWKDRNTALFYALKLEKSVIGFILVLSTIIAGFSVITVLMLLTTQKRKEIGLFMAMGLSATDTRSMFTQVGLMLSMVGLGGGLIFGTIISLIIEKYPLDILPSYYYDT